MHAKLFLFFTLHWRVCLLRLSAEKEFLHPHLLLYSLVLLCSPEMLLMTFPLPTSLLDGVFATFASLPLNKSVMLITSAFNININRKTSVSSSATSLPKEEELYRIVGFKRKMYFSFKCTVIALFVSASCFVVNFCDI